MDASKLVAQLAYHGTLPVEAIHTARALRAEATPVFVETIEKFISGADRSTIDSIWVIFHLLGEWRETSAYRTLARLMRSPADDLDEMFAGTDTDTSHRVMAAVFDGDPAPLYELIHDPEVDEFLRARMFDAVAILTLNGDLPRDEASRFLRSCHSELKPQEENFVWDGWQNAIAVLGLAELGPLVKQAFDRGFISSEWTEFEEFEEVLQQSVDDPAAPLHETLDDYSLFGDTIEELSVWDGVDREEGLEWNDSEWEDDDEEDDEDEDWPDEGRPQITVLPASFSSKEQAVNPYRNVGRNDPCPCGSGKKFKKCCLTDAPGATAIEAD
jgi:hypothetical protein